MPTTFTTGDRITYLCGYRGDEPALGTVTRIGTGWVEVQRDAFPDGPVARLSVLGCKVELA